VNSCSLVFAKCSREMHNQLNIPCCSGDKKDGKEDEWTGEVMDNADGSYTIGYAALEGL
jgi:hypothetical protein